jgi:hypothetical protein
VALWLLDKLRYLGLSIFFYRTNHLAPNRMCTDLKSGPSFYREWGYQGRSGHFDCYAGAEGDVLGALFGLWDVFNRVGGR